MSGDQSNSRVSVRFPSSLSVAELITIMSIAVSITMGWAYFGARITALEKEAVAIRSVVERQSSTTDSTRTAVRVLESRMLQNEIYLDRLYEHLNRPQPRRLPDSSYQ